MSVDGTWTITLKTPMGPQSSTIELVSDATSLSGTQSGNGESGPIYEASASGDTATWKVDITRPMKVTVTFTATVEGDSISGTAKTRMFGSSPFVGSRA